MRFKDKVVIVTGATGGIGSKAVEAFLKEGASVIASDLDAEKLNDLDRELRCSDRMITLAGDITQSATHNAIVDLAVESFGGLDVALNNAGISHDVVRLPLIEDELARRVIDVDLMAVFLAMKAQLPVMAKQYKEAERTGSIVNVASAAGLVAAPLM